MWCSGGKHILGYGFEIYAMVEMKKYICKSEYSTAILSFN